MTFEVKPLTLNVHGKSKRTEQLGFLDEKLYNSANVLFEVHYETKII